MKSLVKPETVVVLQYYGEKSFYIASAQYPFSWKWPALICCVKIQLSDCSHLTIIGVHMPSNGYTD